MTIERALYLYSKGWAVTREADSGAIICYEDK